MDEETRRAHEEWNAKWDYHDDNPTFADRVCQRCGCVVVSTLTDEHDQFHEQIDKAIAGRS